MKLIEAIEAYLTLKHALGAVFISQASILRAFGRILGDIPIDAISSEACYSFCRGTGLPTRHWENKHHTLRGFFNYLWSRGYLAASPLQEPGPELYMRFNLTSIRMRNSSACPIPLAAVDVSHSDSVTLRRRPAGWGSDPASAL